MKATTTKLLAIIMAILIVISSLSITVAAAQPTTYSKQSNSGTRNEVCTSLSGTSASSYYTGDYTYAELKSSTDIHGDLHDLMKDTHTKITTYNDCKTMVWKVDCEQNDTSHATTLYTSHSMSSGEWDGVWSCNREHVWPQSLGGNNTSGGGADLHHIRPAEASVNSSRGNKLYGTLSGCYTPADNVKGDVARIILYVYVRWGSDWGADSVTEVFQSVDMLLQWCASDPVDTWEMGRNEVVQNIQGNRNVFIDYPELAWQLFGKAVPENMTTPSGAALSGDVPTPPAGGTTPDTPDTPNTLDTFVLKNQSNYVTDKSYTYTSSSGNTKQELELCSNKSDAVSLKYVDNGDGTVSFKAGDKFLYANGTDVKFVTAEDDNTKFVLEEAANGYFIKCATATYNGNPQYLEVYSGYLTCFGMNASNASIYTFTFEGNGAPGSDDSQNPSTPVTEKKLATFDFGAIGSTGHVDGSELSGSKSYTSGDQTLTLTSLTKVYGGAKDEKGNSCLKMGTSKATGSLSFTVGDDVDKVVIYVAQYKSNPTTVSVNGTNHTISTASNNGEYTAITVDTSENKTVTLATTSSAKRCMVDTIEFWQLVETVVPDNPGDDNTNDDNTNDDNTNDDNTNNDNTNNDNTNNDNTNNDNTNTDTSNDGKTDSTDKDTETSTEEETSATADQDGSKNAQSGGCGASITGGAMVISVLCIFSAITFKKKED